MTNLKNKKILIVILLALVFAAVAAFGVYKLLVPHRTTVYVFNGDYAAGAQVVDAMLTPVEVDSSVVSASYRYATSDYLITKANLQQVLSSAGVLRNDVLAGNILTSSMLSSTGGNRLEMLMKKNAIAVTVATNNVTGVTRELGYGSHVNIYASYNESTSLILQDIRVLGTTYENGVLTSVTLEVDRSQSLQLIHANDFGIIHLGLVDATGYQFEAGGNLTYNMAGFSGAN